MRPLFIDLKLYKMEILLLLSLFTSLFGTAFSLNQRQIELDEQKQLFHESQDFQARREDIAYQRNLPSTTYQDLISQGFNPNLAAQSVMNGVGSPASAGGSPSPLPVPSAINALQSSFGGMSQNIIDQYLKTAQVKNLEANSNKTNVEAGLLPRDFTLRRMSALGQLKVWNKSVEKMAKEMDYSNQMTELVKNQNLYYGRLSEAQIQVYQSQVMEAVSNALRSLDAIKSQQKERQVMDADIAVKEATRSNLIQDTSNKIIEGDLTFQKSERERIAKEFEQNLGNVPLSADAQKMVNHWAESGEYDKIRDFYQCIFDSAMNQELGESIGTPNKKVVKAPLNLWSSEKYDFGNWANPQAFPIWNPYAKPQFQ